MGRGVTRGDDPTDFASFVGARASALLRYAAVLVPDPPQALELTRRTLVEVRGAWDEVVAAGLEEEVRDRLARAAAQPRRGRSAPASPAAGLRAPLPLTDARLAADTSVPSAELVGAVDALPPLHRVVLVRRHVDGQSDGELAARLGRAPEALAGLDRGQVPERLVAPALRAHEGEVDAPLDPVAWVDGARATRSRRRLAVLAAVAAVAVVAWLAAAQLSGSADDVTLVMPPAQDAQLLTWPVTGDRADDTGWLRAAVAAWQRTSVTDSGLAGPVHPLLAQDYGGIPVAMLEARDGAGHARVAVVAGSTPALVTVQELPPDPGESVVALRVPVVFATAGTAILGDEHTDALLLGPQVRSLDPSLSSASQRGARDPIGYQQLTLNARAAARDPGEVGDRSQRWRPIGPLTDTGRLVPMARFATGIVELEVMGDDGLGRSTTWRVPQEEDPQVLLTPDAVQVEAAFLNPFRPGQYEVATQLWREVGGEGAVRARFLRGVTTRDGVTLDLVELVPGADDASPSAGPTRLVQRGVRAHRQVCLSSRGITRLDAFAYPFVAAACTYPLGDGRRATVLQGAWGGQTPLSDPVAVGLRSDGPGGASTRLRRMQIADLDGTRWVSPVAQVPRLLSVTAIDSWNDLPPFVWRWPVGH